MSNKFLHVSIGLFFCGLAIVQVAIALQILAPLFAERREAQIRVQITSRLAESLFGPTGAYALPECPMDQDTGDDLIHEQLQEMNDLCGEDPASPLCQIYLKEKEKSDPSSSF